MRLKYDFDMFAVMPDEVRREFQGMLDEIGMGAPLGQQVALFRDPALVQALSMADDAVKELFIKSGFGLNIYDSGAPDRRYPGDDETARNACVERLAENISAAANLQGADWGGFDLGQFAEDFAMAKPIDRVEMENAASARRAQRKKKSLTRLGLVAGGAIVAASTVSVAINAMTG